MSLQNRTFRESISCYSFSRYVSALQTIEVHHIVLYSTTRGAFGKDRSPGNKLIRLATVRYKKRSCGPDGRSYGRTDPPKCRVWKSHGHVITLPMAITDADISAVRFFAVFCGWMMHLTAVSEEVNRKYLHLRTWRYNFQPILRATIHFVANRQTDVQTNESIKPIADHTTCIAVRSAKNMGSKFSDNLASAKFCHGTLRCDDEIFFLCCAHGLVGSIMTNGSCNTGVVFIFF